MPSFFVFFPYNKQIKFFIIMKKAFLGRICQETCGQKTDSNV